MEGKKRRGTGRVTLADVAKLAGVGAMTVSRALRRPDMVSEKLKDKIDSAVAELGYVPNSSASALASASSNVVAVVTSSLADYGNAETIAGLQEVLIPAGYQLMLAESQNQEEREQQLLETFMSYNLAAVILFDARHSAATYELLANAHLPIAELGAAVEHPLDINIGIDNAAAVYALTEHLISLGYSKIGLMCAAQRQWVSQQRLRGWHRALLDNNMSTTRVLGSYAAANFSTGAELLPELVLNWPDMDALICSSDELACGALFECQRRKIRVPKELAIVGFGNSDVSKVCFPPLTTVAVPHREIGVQAGKALLARLQDEAWQPQKPITSILCKRESC
ncbi:LacI family DNA-binding transcriptional regulator [Rahnella sp. SAP-1]|uniref:LacI family DNA-binding transcriptional regulator n=1 Tax=Rouxiella aceris TaxID=2703884 RepID=A0A848MSH2_9GAMM|nr:LacI family DNA-binding transcriptional regulator [Rouxiella aceris]NMP29921.1 LacI family DNA-binding transcriptional regulator [Rouxiella aceris]